MFGISSLYIWMIVVIACVATEAFTLSLSAIWFAVGGLAALVAASIGLGVSAQLVIFVLFSAVLLALLRPFCRRFLKTRQEPTNADRIIGAEAVVVEAIDNLQQTGEVRVFGQRWTARSFNNEPIQEGETVRIIEIRGVKAIVEKVKN